MVEHLDVKPGLIVHASARRVVRAFGDEMHLHLSKAQTHGRVTLWTNITPPGGGPPPHYHLHEDELFLPMEGRVSFFYQGQWTPVEPGTTVFMPRGTVHTFKNTGDTPLRMVVQTAPGGFDEFFEACAAEFAQGNTPDMDRIVAISAEFGIHYVAG